MLTTPVRDSRVMSTFLKFPAKHKAALCFLTATGVGVTTFQATSTNFLSSSSSQSQSSNFLQNVRAEFYGVLRSSRAISTITLIVFDYKYSLQGLPIKSDEYLSKLSEIHLRSANRLRKLCESNRGFYVKAGQFVAALTQVPKEYSTTLSSLQDQAVPCDFKAIKQVLMANLTPNLSEMFLSIDEQPVAAASIAQVHHAVLIDDHQEVAIKVQYPGLAQQMRIDTRTMSFLSKSIAWIFPEYRFDWLESEFLKTISVELDFIQEAKNAERTAQNFRNNKFVRVPLVFEELTTRQVLTMQFFRGHKVDDVEFINQTGINPVLVAKVLVDVFAEMIFIHGFVHGDPHPGNILVSQEGQHGFSIVVLDHGIYKQLDEGFRQDYCQLWKALILLDSTNILRYSERFGIGKYAKYMPLIFTGRTMNSKSALGGGMSPEEKGIVKEELKSLTMEDISSFMESLPPDFLTILRTDGLIKSILQKLGAPQRIRLLSYARSAVFGLYPKIDPQSDSVLKVLISRLTTTLSYLHLRFIIGMLEALSVLQATNIALRNFYRRFLVSFGTY